MFRNINIAVTILELRLELFKFYSFFLGKSSLVDRILVETYPLIWGRTLADTAQKFDSKSIVLFIKLIKYPLSILDFTRNSILLTNILFCINFNMFRINELVCHKDDEIGMQIICNNFFCIAFQFGVPVGSNTESKDPAFLCDRR